MNLSAMRNMRMPAGGGATGSILRAVAIGGALLYGAANSLFNVEGGHRAIMFNRLSGVKDTVRDIVTDKIQSWCVNFLR